MHSDPIADMLTRIRNACMRQKPVVDVPASNLKVEIVKLLQEHQFIKKFVVLQEGAKKNIRILLKYAGQQPVIQGIERVSVPGRRSYSSCTNLEQVKNGLGIAIVSTSKGVVTDHKARELKVGGEVLCRVW